MNPHRNAPPIEPITPRQREVLVVSHYFAAHGGGIERVVAELIRAIGGSDNFHFTWAASNCDPAPQLGAHRAVPMRSTNFIERALGLPLPIWSLGSFRKLKKLIRASDVVWLQDTLYLGNMMAFRYARRLKKPILITQHIGVIPYKNPLLRALMKIADALITSNMLRAADQTTFISDRVAEDYYRRIPFSMPVQIIPNGVDRAVFTLAPPAKRALLRNRYALRDDQPVMLFIGRFVEKKGLKTIRRLAELLPDWRFWLAGAGPIDPMRWGLPNIHVFTGRSGEELAELYQAADKLLLPSYGEGFPLVIQEAFACGLPVMCSEATARGSNLARPLLETVEVVPNDSDATAQIWLRHLREQLNTLPLREPQRDLAVCAETYWQWPAIASAYADLLRSLCKREAE